MDDSTKPLRCVTIMENNCQSPIFIRVSPIWMIIQNHFVDRHNHYVHPTLTPTVSQYRKTTVRAPGLFIRKHYCKSTQLHTYPKDFCNEIIFESVWSSQIRCVMCITNVEFPNGYPPFVIWNTSPYRKNPSNFLMLIVIVNMSKYNTLKKRRTRIHAYVHLWYATKTLTDLYHPPKRLPTSNTLTCLPYAYLLTCLPHFPWPQTLTCLPAYHMPCGHRP